MKPDDFICPQKRCEMNRYDQDPRSEFLQIPINGQPNQKAYEMDPATVRPRKFSLQCWCGEHTKCVHQECECPCHVRCTGCPTLELISKEKQ